MHRQPNHLLGYRRTFIQLFFKNQNDLFTVRRELLPLATKNREKLDAVDTYAEVISGENGFDMDFDMEDGVGNGKSFAQSNGAGNAGAPSDSILDIREYDLPYYLRVAIDKGELRSSFPLRFVADFFADVRVGLWYEVTALHGDITIEVIKERVSRAEPVVMAFDIETTKAPLKFPDNQQDQVMMISYMIDGQVSLCSLFCVILRLIARGCRDFSSQIEKLSALISRTLNTRLPPTTRDRSSSSTKQMR